MSALEPADGFERHTDCPACAEDVLIAYEAILPAVGGDRMAAAILAAATVFAEALQRDRD